MAGCSESVRSSSLCVSWRGVVVASGSLGMDGEEGTDNEVAAPADWLNRAESWDSVMHTAPRDRRSAAMIFERDKLVELVE